MTFYCHGKTSRFRHKLQGSTDFTALFETLHGSKALSFEM